VHRDDNFRFALLSFAVRRGIPHKNLKALDGIKYWGEEIFMSWNSEADYNVMQPIIYLLKEKCKLKPGEHVTIVGDFATDTETIRALSSAAGSLGGIVTVVIHPNTGWNTEDPFALPPIVPIAYEKADVIIEASESFSVNFSTQLSTVFLNTDMSKKSRFHGMGRPFKEIRHWGHYYKKEIEPATEKLALLHQILVKSKEARLTSPNGTDLKGKIGDNTKVWPFKQNGPSKVSKDWICESVQTAKFPGMSRGAGLGLECHFVPNVGTAEGVYVADGPCHLITDWPEYKNPDEPIKFTIKKGKVVNVEGGRDADKVRQLLKTIIHADMLAEFGVGMDPFWVKSGATNMEKKGLGNIHFAYGDPRPGHGFVWHVGDPVCPIHCDNVAYRGAFWLDGKKLVDDGKYLY